MDSSTLHFSQPKSFYIVLFSIVYYNQQMHNYSQIMKVYIVTVSLCNLYSFMFRHFRAIYIYIYIHIHTHTQGDADKFLARPTSRYRRTEVSLEGVVCSCAKLQVFYCYRG